MSAPAAPAKLELTVPGVYHLDYGQYGVLYDIGRKWMHVVECGHRTRCVELPKTLQLRPVLMSGAPYPVKRCAEIMLKTVHPITDRAREVLKSLAAGTAATEEEFS